MSKIELLTLISEEDGVALAETIFELEAMKQLFNEAKRSVDCEPVAFEAIMGYYMHSLKRHKTLWTSILNKYVGEENASNFRSLYKFDIQKRAIFKSKGCTSCGV